MSEDKRQATACLLTATNGLHTYLESSLPSKSTSFLLMLDPPPDSKTHKPKSADSYPRLPFRGSPKDQTLEQRIRAGKLPSKSANGQEGPERDGGSAKSEPQKCFCGGAFRRNPYMVRVSGDFLPKLFVVTSTKLSVCKL